MDDDRYDKITLDMMTHAQSISGEHLPLWYMMDALATAICGGDACDVTIFQVHEIDSDPRAKTPNQVGFHHLKTKFEQCGYGDNHPILAILLKELHKDHLHASRCCLLESESVQAARLGEKTSATKQDEVIIKHSPTDIGVRFSKNEMREQEPTCAMLDYNRSITASLGVTSIAELVHKIDATDATATAAAAVAHFLDHDDVDADGLKWTRFPKRLMIKSLRGSPSVTMLGYDSYGYSAARRHNAKQQRNNTLIIDATGFRMLCDLRDKFRVTEKDSELMSRPATAFVLSAVFLLEEMQRHAGIVSFVDGHMPNSANPQAAFGWHVDNHAELESGPYIDTSFVCQCSAGVASMAVAGMGEIHYPGPGGMIRFPSWALHRTMNTVITPSASMWKLAGFFAATEDAMRAYKIVNHKGASSLPYVHPTAPPPPPAHRGSKKRRSSARTLSSLNILDKSDIDDIDRLFKILDVTDADRQLKLRNEISSRGCRILIKDRITKGRSGDRIFTDTDLRYENRNYKSRRDILELFSSWY
jgi:hypothetical protein